MANDVNVRALALETLTEVDRGRKNASEMIQSTLRNYQYLDKKDRAFYTRLCQGTLEYRIQLDYLIDQVSKTPVQKCKPYIRNLLRMSLYQIRYMDRVADQVVCNEAVKLAKKKGFQNLSGFVNGVLRNLIRQQDTLTLPKRPEGLGNPSDTPDVSLVQRMDGADRQEVIRYLSITYSVPEYMIEWFLQWYPVELAEKVLRQSLQESSVSIRVNLEKISVKALTELLEQSGITVTPGIYCRNTLRISDYNYINRIPGYREGYFTVQDESSCLQGYLIPVQELIGTCMNSVPSSEKELQILDLCAAPGGKVMHAAERFTCAAVDDTKDSTDSTPGDPSTRCVADDGGVCPVRITARDLSEQKIARIQENLDRMGYSGIHTEIYDATEYDPSLEREIDLIIADLPCSGLGVMGRKKDIKYRLTPEQPGELMELQRTILRNAVRYLRPGGYLIYSTCTLNPGENEEQVSWMQEELHMTAVSIRQDLPEQLVQELDGQPGTNLEQGYCTLLPGQQDCDGFFMAKLQYQSI